MADPIRKESSADKSARSIAIEDLAVRYKLQGLDTNEIAERIGIEAKMAALALRRGLRRAKADVRENGKHIIDLEMLRLDQLFSIAWAKATRGEPDGIRDCLKVMERRAKFLGMDAAVKFEVAKAPAVDLENMSAEDLAEMERLLERNSVSSDEDLGDEGDTDYGDSTES